VGPFLYYSDRYNGISKSVERETVPDLRLLGALPLGSAAALYPSDGVEGCAVATSAPRLPQHP
jgi:hypothetical protein